MIGMAALAFVSGILIGCIGIGGALLVPGLSIAGIDVHKAISASMFSFIFAGFIGVWLYARKGSIDWAPTTWLCSGAAPGALIGALIATHLNGQILLALVGVTVVSAGARVFARQPHAPAPGRSVSPVILCVVGAAVGAGSALTGTSGPVLLVPLLIGLGTPVLASVGLSQAIQIPIAVMASLGNLWSGSLNWRLAGVLSLGLALGAPIGVPLAHKLPAHFLTRIVAIALVIIGALLVLKSG